MPESLNQWRLLRTGHHTGAMNMAIDDAILRHVSEGGPPTLRFYGWEPAAISVGYFQNVEKEVDLAACKSAGVDVVRRPTGGRAVLHSVEVTYSLAIPEENPWIPRGITESYRQISEGIVAGLVSLGLDAKMVSLNRRKGASDARSQATNGTNSQPSVGAQSMGTQPSKGTSAGRIEEVMVEAPQGKFSSAACFDAPSWYEVTVDGKKVVGSAQTRRMGVLLQHGSIPLELQADTLFACLRFRSEQAEARAKRSFLAKATSIREALGRAVSFMETSDAVIAGIEQALGVRMIEGELSQAERTKAHELARTRYNRLDWNEDRRKDAHQTA